MKKQETKGYYETQYIYGVKLIFKDWVPKDIIISVSSPDDHGLQQVVIQKIDKKV